MKANKHNPMNKVGSDGKGCFYQASCSILSSDSASNSGLKDVHQSFFISN